ncbi:MAG: sigma-70 family RNA polymerase sigma factor [Acidobacteriota bacterium]
MGELTGSISSGVSFEEKDALVVRLKERDETAFAEVFNLYRDLVFTLSLNMLADKSEAMDVTQEVFLTLYRKIHQFRAECSLKTWLYRVTLNQAANRNRWWKRRFRHPNISLNLSLNGDGHKKADPVSDQPGPDRQVLSLEIRKALQRSLDQLPFEQRAAVTLRDLCGLSYEEIASLSGVQIGTVKSRIARGREKLKELLKPYRERGAL